jgi:hypothetical protein
MRPVFFKLTLWNDPQARVGRMSPIFRDACRAANRTYLTGLYVLTAEVIAGFSLHRK